MSTFIFLCGSSSVGKTSLLNEFPESYVHVNEYHDKIFHDITKVKMEFREIRARLGNPSWEDCYASDIGVAQQEAGMGIYEERINALAKSAKRTGIYLLERCPFDISGYSFAFRLPTPHIQDMVDRSVSLIDNLLQNDHRVVLVFRPVQPSFEYDRQNNARPSEEIRGSCNDFLMDFILNRCAVEWKPGTGIKTYYSVNQGMKEIHEILSRI